MATPLEHATSYVGAPQHEVDARHRTTRLRNLLRWWLAAAGAEIPIGTTVLLPEHAPKSASQPVPVLDLFGEG